jgi:hypothetical protein
MKEFKVLPRAVVHKGKLTVIAMYSCSGYKTIADVVQRIKTDPLQLARATLLAAIEQGQYWESIQ